MPSVTSSLHSAEAKAAKGRRRRQGRMNLDLRGIDK